MIPLLPSNVCLALGAGLYIVGALHGTLFVTRTFGSPLLRMRPQREDPTGRVVRAARRASYRSGLAHLGLAAATMYAGWVTLHRPTLAVLALVLALGLASAFEPLVQLYRRTGAGRSLGAGTASIALLLSIIPAQVLLTAATGGLR